MQADSAKTHDADGFRLGKEVGHLDPLKKKKRKCVPPDYTKISTALPESVNAALTDMA